mgnify:CR=1 FL=1
MNTLFLLSNDDTMIAFIVGVILFIIGVFITRWIFMIDKMHRHSRAQTRLLANIALKQGLEDSTIDKIVSDVEDDFIWRPKPKT